jgi:hypothetical protein
MNKKNLHKKPYIILIFASFIILISFIYLVNRDKNLIESYIIKYDDEVNVKVTSVFNNHNILELNNRDLMISGTYPVINQDELVNKVKEKNISGTLWNDPNTSEFKPVLSDIEPPFRLLKKAYSDTLKIIKQQDTILVLMNK